MHRFLYQRPIRFYLETKISSNPIRQKKRPFFKVCIFLFLACTTSLVGAVEEKILQSLYSEGVSVDLRNPTYSDGVLTTTEGGVISAKDIRIQAQKITYTNRFENEVLVTKIEAEGQIILNFSSYLLIGEVLEYDLIAKRGYLTNGKTGIEPWFFGGDHIDLLPNGCIRIRNSYITTSQNKSPEWSLNAQEVLLNENLDLSARSVQFQIHRLPVFWIPSFNTNLRTVFDSPIRYRFRSGGRQGPRLGIIYEALSWEDLKVFLRFDYRFERGPSGGLETVYKKGNHELHTISYIARDSSILDPDQRTRYRFEGVYKNSWDCDRNRIHLTYDKLSDQEMPTDYQDKDLDLITAHRTELYLHRQQNNAFIANLTTRVRINDFQSIKQELPSLTITPHPFTLGCTGILFAPLLRIGYLDFRYADDVGDVTNYHSGRIELRQSIYRPFTLGPCIFTPETEGIAIYYENTPSGESEWLALIRFSGSLNTSLTRNYPCFKHTIVPYLRYDRMTNPSLSFTRHYIFDEKDGLNRLQSLRFGLRNLLYRHSPCSFFRSLSLDTYAYAFFETSTIPNSIPKVYNTLLWNSFSTLRHTFTTAWDTERNHLDHFNLRTDWTVSNRLALSWEYRHRDATSWRKAQPLNFVLESARSETSLTNSSLSDQRDTLLYHFYYRLMRTLAVEGYFRHGWNRFTEPPYTEYQLDLHTTVSSVWKVRLSYQKREDDHRVAFYITLANPP